MNVETLTALCSKVGLAGAVLVFLTLASVYLALKNPALMGLFNQDFRKRFARIESGPQPHSDAKAGSADAGKVKQEALTAAITEDWCTLLGGAPVAPKDITARMNPLPLGAPLVFNADTRAPFSLFVHAPNVAKRRKQADCVITTSTQDEKRTTALFQTSKRFGVAGSALLHCALFLACVSIVPRANPTPLPPPVEAVRITLGEAAAARSGTSLSPEPERAPTQAAEQPRKQPPEPQKEQPLPEKEAVAVVKKKAEPQVKEKPRKTAAAASPTPAASAPRTEAPASAGTGTSPTGQTQQMKGTAEEARQSLLSALIARIEREKRYPTAARRLGFEGQVTAVVQIDEKGNITGVHTQGNHAPELLEKATLEALHRVMESWKAVPVLEPMTLNIPIRYTLKDA